MKLQGLEFSKAYVSLLYDIDLGPDACPSKPCGRHSHGVQSGSWRTHGSQSTKSQGLRLHGCHILLQKEQPGRGTAADLQGTKMLSTSYERGQKNLNVGSLGQRTVKNQRLLDQTH